MNIDSRSKLNRLLKNTIGGGLLFSEWLKQNGYSDQLLRQYRQSQWLSSLAGGVMYRSGDKLSAIACLQSFNTQLNKHYRIAALSALELFGYNHYVPMGKPVMTVFNDGSHSPEWLKSDKFDRTIKVFSTKTFLKTSTETVDYEGVKTLVSSPEQAFLECLLLAEKMYSFTDLYYVLEQLTSLRPELLQTMLENTDSQKVKRMFLYMAEKSGHYWFDALDLQKISLGTSKLQLVKGGCYIPKYKIIVPVELENYE